VNDVLRSDDGDARSVCFLFRRVQVLSQLFRGVVCDVCITVRAFFRCMEVFEAE
jgi:hypothetical protein